MITSLSTSLMRVTFFWYVLGALVLFIGDPDWAEALYHRLSMYPWVPVLEMHGLGTAAAVQWRLLLYWTVPMTFVWAASFGVGALVAEIKCQLGMRKQRLNLKPLGEFWGVVVHPKSIGRLPSATTPALVGSTVVMAGPGENVGAKNVARVELKGAMKEAAKMLTPAERKLSEELLQLLLASPDHYAGAGHGVGLLEHTLNVVTEAAAKVTPEFRMPLIAALSHDIGKLITFQPDGDGGWKRKGLHSRESARILATLPAFQQLPELHQRALLLSVKYDHAPNKMPELRGEREAVTLAMRTISALSQADRKATADEKERNLERLQPEDLLWKDFVDFLREAPVVQRGKKGAANQVNNPPESPYLFLYEAPWRDAAVRRLPEEVAAALDLTRRDSGKMAKYTRILVERLRKEGLLVESYVTKDKDGVATELFASDTNPLWDIQSGTGDKAVVLRGILVLQADALWKKLNYRISIKSPFPVQILAPNADADGRVNDAPRANKDEPRAPDVSDGLKLADVSSTDAMAALGLTAEPSADSAKSVAKPKTRARGGFRSEPVSTPANDAILGLKPETPGAKPVTQKVQAPAPAATPTTVDPDILAELSDQEAQQMEELAAAMAGSASASPEMEDTTSMAMDNALAFLTPGDDGEDMVTPDAPEEVPVAEVPVAVEAQPDVTDSPVSVQSPKPQSKQPEKTPATAKTSATEAPAAPATPDAEELSRSERREGLAIADSAAVAQYPNLKVGDKFYTEHSRAVQAGLKKPGSRYKGDNKEKQLDLTESGPRRGRRRITS